MISSCFGYLFAIPIEQAAIAVQSRAQPSWPIQVALLYNALPIIVFAVGLISALEDAISVAAGVAVGMVLAAWFWNDWVTGIIGILGIAAAICGAYRRSAGTPI
jgi:predicted anti-sigma-YlaC factor YlaD